MQMILAALGYMTPAQAVANGLTHHASYYGLPVWVGGLETDELMVAAKWAPAEWLMPAMHTIEGVLLQLFFPEREPSFMFKVYGPIEKQD